MDIELLDKTYKKVKLYAWITAALCLLLAAVTAVTIIFVTKTTLRLAEILLLVADLGIVFVIIYISTVSLPKAVGYKKYASLMSKLNPSEIRGTVTDVSDDRITVHPGVQAYEVEILVDGEYKKIYLCDLLDKNMLTVNQPYTFYVVSTFIKEAKQ